MIHAVVKHLNLDTVVDVTGIEDQITIKIPREPLVQAFKAPLTERKSVIE